VLHVGTVESWSAEELDRTSAARTPRPDRARSFEGARRISNVAAAAALLGVGAASVGEAAASGLGPDIGGRAREPRAAASVASRGLSIPIGDPAIRTALRAFEESIAKPIRTKEAARSAAHTLAVLVRTLRMSALEDAQVRDLVHAAEASALAAIADGAGVRMSILRPADAPATIMVVDVGTNRKNGDERALIDEASRMVAAIERIVSYPRTVRLEQASIVAMKAAIDDLWTSPVIASPEGHERNEPDPSILLEKRALLRDLSKTLDRLLSIDHASPAKLLGEIDSALERSAAPPDLKAEVRRLLGSLTNAPRLVLPAPIRLSFGPGGSIDLPAGSWVAPSEGRFSIGPGSAGEKPQVAIEAYGRRLSAAVETATVDLAERTLELTGAELDLSSNGAIGSSPHMTASKLALALDPDPAALRFHAEGLGLANLDAIRTLSAARADVAFVDGADGSPSLRIDGLDVVSDFGRAGVVTARGRSSLLIEAAQDGSRRNATITGDRLELADRHRILDLGGAHISATMARDRVVAIDGSATDGTYRASFGTFALSNGGSFSARYGAGGALESLAADVAALDFARGGSRLDMTGGRLEAQFAGSRGELSRAKIHADTFAYRARPKFGRETTLVMGTGDAVLETSRSGDSLTFTARDSHLRVHGDRLDVEFAKSVAVKTDEKGLISKVDATFAGPIRFEREGGKILAGVDDARLGFDRAERSLTFSFSRAGVELKSKGIAGLLEGGTLSSTPTALRLHLDSAAAADIGGSFGATVEAVDLELGRVGSRFKTFDLWLGGLKGRISGVNVWVRTVNGERLRLHLESDESGRLIQRAYLQIPAGGEIALEKAGRALTFGPQNVQLDRDPAGVYRLTDVGAKIDYRARNAAVHVEGGSADVRYDPKSGALMISAIDGTKIAFDYQGHRGTLDVRQLDGFLVQAMGVPPGVAQGGALQLAPTSDRSRLNVSFLTHYAGIPLRAEFRDLHALEALATATTNEVHVFVGDPTGHGRTRLSVGPFKLSGSAIEVMARYHQYDGYRLLDALDRAIRPDDVQLLKGIGFSQDAVRIGTPWESGPWTRLTVVLPHEGDDSSPGRSERRGGAIFGFGLATKRGDTRESHGLFLGAMPGSILEIQERRGHPSFAGVPVPDEGYLPTTLVGGYSYGLTTPRGELSATAGAFANPAGLVKAPKGLWNEPVEFGPFVQLGYATDKARVSLGAALDMKKHGVAPLVTLTLGVKF
jgi:hypothetical protein